MVKKSRFVSSMREVAEAFGVTPQAVGHWQFKGMPKPSSKGYDLDSIREWNDSRQDRRSTLSAGKGESKPDDLRSRKTRAETRKINQEIIAKRLRNGILSNDLIAYSDVKQWLASLVLRLKQRLESLPNEMQVYAPPEIRGQFRDSLESFIFELLTEISDWEHDNQQFQYRISDPESAKSE